MHRVPARASDAPAARHRRRPRSGCLRVGGRDASAAAPVRGRPDAGNAAAHRQLPQLDAHLRGCPPLLYTPGPRPRRGKHASAAEPPVLWRWERNKQPELVERFRERLARAAIPKRQAAVLAWTNTLVDRLNGRKGSDRPVGSWLLRVLGAAAVERDERMGPTGDTFRRLDRAVAFVALGSGRPTNSTHEQRERIRTASAQLLGDLPTVEGELRAWNLSARDV